MTVKVPRSAVLFSTAAVVAASKACAIIPPYVQGAPLQIRPGPLGLARAPSTLSLGDTRWNCSGCRASIFPARPVGPRSGRLTQRISVLLLGGPTAWDASAELPRCVNVGPRLLPRKPQIVVPLNSSLASPAQNSWRRNTAP